MREIRNQDCVKYHKLWNWGKISQKCYQKYTNFLKGESKDTKSKYDKSFQAFCEEIIDEGIIKHKQIGSITALGITSK